MASDAALPRAIWATKVPKYASSVARAIRLPAHGRTTRSALLVTANSSRRGIGLGGYRSRIGISSDPNDKGGENNNGGLE